MKHLFKFIIIFIGEITFFSFPLKAGKFRLYLEKSSFWPIECILTRKAPLYSPSKSRSFPVSQTIIPKSSLYYKGSYRDSFTEAFKYHKQILVRQYSTKQGDTFLNPKNNAVLSDEDTPLQTITKKEATADLAKLGWSNTFQKSFDKLNQAKWIPARVLSEDKGYYMVKSQLGELAGRISGKYRYFTKSRADFPAVGDWVAIETLSSEDTTAIIHALLPRNTVFSRKTAGSKTEEQVIAANIDTMFIVFGLDNSYNLRGIERYITLTRSSGTQPVLILNKMDLINDVEKLTTINHEVKSVAIDTPTHFISSTIRSGLIELNKYFSFGKTVALIGPSGVGKSTLTNILLGNSAQKTGNTRESDSKGRHITTRRQLFLLPTEGMIIDMPGMRELQLWMDVKDLDTSFSDIKALSIKCHFKDCNHDMEPRCAIKEAIVRGELDPARLKSYRKMLRELQYLINRRQEKPWESRIEGRKFAKEKRNFLKYRRNNYE